MTLFFFAPLNLTFFKLTPCNITFPWLSLSHRNTHSVLSKTFSQPGLKAKQTEIGI